MPGGSYSCLASTMLMCIFVSGGMQLDDVQLYEATSKEEFARRIGERARITPNGEWVQGGNWDETKWIPPVIPTKELVDPFTLETPVFVIRYDGHMVLANLGCLAHSWDHCPNAGSSGRRDRP